MVRWLCTVSVACLVAVLPLRLHAAKPNQTTSAIAVPAVERQALIDRYCVSCHSQRLKRGGLVLEGVSLANVSADAAQWEKVIRKLRAGLMPPPGSARPDQANADAFAGWLESEIDRVAAVQPDPGRTESLHRLNRAEYQNAIRDLLAVEIDARSWLPADDASYGFDNNATSLKMSDSLMERYLIAARNVSRLAVGGAPPPSAQTVRMSPHMPQYRQLEGLPFGTRGGALFRHTFPVDGEYAFTIQVVDGGSTGGLRSNTGAGHILPFPPQDLEILIDNERVKAFTVVDPARQRYGENIRHESGQNGYEVRVPVKAGPRQVGVTFRDMVPGYGVQLRKPFERPYHVANAQTAMATYGPFLDSVTIAGPYNVTGPGDTPSRRRIFTCHPGAGISDTACATSILSRLARHAYRRPVDKTDVPPLLAAYRDGRVEGSFEDGIETALRALLVDVNFLFRIETEPESAGRRTAAVRSSAPGSYRISGLELASRLSFFLWSSIPDEELLKVAASGALEKPAVLEQQVRRMLTDPRSRALVDNFASQWLHLRNLDATVIPDTVFPDFDDALRDGLGRETRLFFQSVLREDRPVTELLTADYTFVDQRLARHYGIPNVQGSSFRRVKYPDGRRRGLLGHGSILTVTSMPARTSPVRRGKWLLENILGTPPPPPPANVPPLEEKKTGAAPRSMRDRMAAHRKNPACSSCHNMIDPLGFALENFDATGRWRDVDETVVPIDPAGVLPNGTKFATLDDFRTALLRRPENFVTVVVEKLMTYALGRGLEHSDMPAIRAIVRESARTDYRVSSLMLGIAKSIPFQMRRAES